MVGPFEKKQWREKYRIVKVTRYNGNVHYRIEKSNNALICPVWCQYDMTLYENYEDARDATNKYFSAEIRSEEVVSQ